MSYTYDALYRLTVAQAGATATPTWKLGFTYDRYANRTAQTVLAGTGVPSNTVTINPAANRITDPGYSYDANGNMTTDGVNALVYAAENRMVSSSGSTYGYDGNSLRVVKTSGGTTTVYVFDRQKVIAEYVNGVLGEEYIYLGKDLLAAYAGATLIYYHRDHLSVRTITDGTSGTVVGQQAHYPYAETWYATGTTTDYRFTSYKRDAESGNDYAVFRYDVNRLGRFASPDPIAGSFAVPQSLNRYGYVAGDPVNRIDPAGLRGFDDFFPPPFGFCSPFPFRVTLLIDGLEVPPFLICPRSLMRAFSWGPFATVICSCFGQNVIPFGTIVKECVFRCSFRRFNCVRQQDIQ